MPARSSRLTCDGSARPGEAERQGQHGSQHEPVGEGHLTRDHRRSDAVVHGADEQPQRVHRGHRDAGEGDAVFLPDGAEFEKGNLTLEDLRNYAAENGEPAVTSGRQEYLENLINRYI